MTRLPIAAIVAAGLTLPAPDHQAVFRAGVDSVAVDVSVMAGTRPVAGLTAADFVVTDNGEPQEILEVTYESLPIDVTLVVDVSGSVTGVLLASLQRALTDVRAALRPGDRARLVTFNHRLREAVPWSDASAIGPGQLTLVPGGHTSLLDALAVAFVTEPTPGRRQMLILFTDGRDTMSLADEAAVVDVARRSEAAAFVIAVTEGSPGYPLPPAHEKLFRTITDATGGQMSVLPRGQSLSASFLRAVANFRSSYVIRYTLQSDRRHGWHDIQVHVTRPGRHDVRARRGYFAR